MQFRPPALNSGAKWQTLLDHHTKIAEFKGIERGAKLKASEAGVMIGVGSRQPSGGLPGDGYREYDTMKGEDIKTLFSYAYVSHCFSFIF